MATLRELKTRIGSVSSSEKITGAMKMISSAKVHKSEQALRKLWPFKEQIKSIMSHILASGENFTSPLIEARETKRLGIVVFGSDDGLCGAYNMNIFKSLLGVLAAYRKDYPTAEIVLIPVGKKILRPCMKLNLPHVKVEPFEGVDSKMDGKRVTDFTLRLQEKFLGGEMDMVDVCYMRFISMSRQVFRHEALFPVNQNAIIGEVENSKSRKEDNKMYLFEPNPQSIFNEVLPMFVMSTMQEITIENRSSELAARVMAMQSANDNAKKLQEQLQLEYNKLRQQSITNELLDIVGGQKRD